MCFDFQRIIRIYFNTAGGRWFNLCYLAVVPAKAEADAEGPAREERVVGCIVCKQDAHRTTPCVS